MTHASAIAFRVLVSLVPLTLLALGLMGALGLEDVWEDEVGPAIAERVTSPVYTAIDFSVEKIFATSTAGLVLFASALLLWHLAWGVRTIMEALNAVHDVVDERPWHERLVTAVALAVATGTCLVGAFLAVVVLPRLGSGLAAIVLTGVAWFVAIGLLTIAAGLLVRYAPAERPDARWASAGSVLAVGTWVVASVVFGWWAGSVANYKSAVGALVVFLVLTAYVLVSSAVFLVAVEVDELARTSPEAEE